MNAKGKTGNVFYCVWDYFKGNKRRTISSSSDDLSGAGNYNKSILLWAEVFFSHLS
ncbi:MAG: hypothetical protein ACM31E_03850 [Fibrobacterota bacterium]